ncbi:MAG: hypothetical protein KR126chlam3_01599 [Chlamydiae bacterium]|nr:hypothetical protein [Chlamydiota bacterium]
MKELLVDIAHLSRKRCSVPIPGLLAYATKENFLGRVVIILKQRGFSFFLEKLLKLFVKCKNLLLKKGLASIFLMECVPTEL